MKNKLRYSILLLVVLLGSLLSWHVRADSPRGPAIVADISRTGLTANVSQTTLWTPAANGWYLVHSVYAVTSGSCTPSDQITWTDVKANSRSLTGIAGDGWSSPYAIYAESGQAISYTVTQGGSCTYDYFLVLTKE